MLRPSRRAKQKPMQSHEIVGILPSEEAAIHKALVASLAKQDTTSESGISPPRKTTGKRSSNSPPKKIKLGRSAKLSNTSPKLLNPTGNYRDISPKSASISPRSTSSSISFMTDLSSDSLSSTLWTPGQTTPTSRSKGQRKTTAKRNEVKKLTKNTKKVKKVKKQSPPIKDKKKLSPLSVKRYTVAGKAVSNSLKSIHITKTVLQEKTKRKTKLLARAVRKKATASDEPRNHAGHTVDEIIMAIARLGKMNQRSKSKSPKATSSRMSTSPKSSSQSRTPVRHNSKSLSPKSRSPKSPPTPGKLTPQKKRKSPPNSPSSTKNTPKLSPKSKTTTKQKAKVSPKTSKLPKSNKKITPKSLEMTPKRTTPKSDNSKPRAKVPKPVSTVALHGKVTNKVITDKQVEGQSSMETNAESAVSKDPGEKSADSSEKQCPNSCSYQAQRKFASNHSPPTRPSNQNLASPPELKETPKTEDFINFLCLRGSGFMPKHLQKFDFPWTPIRVDENAGGHKEGNGRNNGKSNPSSRDKSSTGVQSAAKKLDFNSASIQVT